MPAGTDQSPIDIVRADVTPRTDLAPLRLRYPVDPIEVRARFAVVDGDETPDGVVVVPQVVVTVPPAADAHVTLGAMRFDLESLHWHSPSEHLLDGESFPLELHLVHRSREGDLLVVGVLSEDGTEDTAIAPVFDLIGPLAASGVDIEPMPVIVRLDDLVAVGSPMFRYRGSLTTAPFTEGVSWFVCAETRTASSEQIDAHMRFVSGAVPGFDDRPQPPGNARSPQALAGRVVTIEADGTAG